MKRSPLWWKDLPCDEKQDLGEGGTQCIGPFVIHNFAQKHTTCKIRLAFLFCISICICQLRIRSQTHHYTTCICIFPICFHFLHCNCFPRLNQHQAVAGDHWAGVGVLVAAKEGAWLLRPSRAPEKVALIFMFETTFWGWRLIQWRGLLVQMCYEIWFPRNSW